MPQILITPKDDKALSLIRHLADIDMISIDREDAPELPKANQDVLKPVSEPDIQYKKKPSDFRGMILREDAEKWLKYLDESRNSGERDTF